MNDTKNRSRRPWLLGLICSALWVSSASANSNSAPPNRTGAPGHGTCADCHTGSGSGNVSLSFSGGTDYLPGQSYSLSVTVTDPSKVRWGFALAARDTDNDTTNVGTLSSGGGDNSPFGPGNNQIGHVGGPVGAGSYTFTVNWEAPDIGVGDVTFYVAANAANGDGANGPGDVTYTKRLTISQPPPPNEAPSFTVPGATANVTTEVPVPIAGILVNDSDAGAGNVTVSLSVGNGILTVADSVAGGVGEGGITGNGSASVTVDGTLAEINATFADASGIVYQSNPGYLGNEMLELMANDNGNTGSGGAQTGSAMVAISVHPPPKFGNPVYLGDAGFQFTLTGIAGNTYIVEHSDNLETWNLLEEVTLVSDSATVTHPGAATAPRRFYRAAENVP